MRNKPWDGPIDNGNSDIMPVNIAAFDLNLLVVFDAVMNERNVSRAAVRVGMSQSAVSNALNRLRGQLQDQLFIRTAEGVRPTKRAVEMAAEVAEGLKNLQVALEPRGLPMDARHWKFVISMSEQAMIAVLPRLLSVIEASSRSVSLHTRPKSNKTIQEQIDAMQVDLAVGTIPNLPPRFDRNTLFHDTYMIMMAKNNALSRRGVSAEEFPSLEQIAVVKGDPESSMRIDRELRARGTSRNIVMNVTQYQVLPKVLKATSLISLVPRCLIPDFDQEEFSFHDLPFDIPEVEVLSVIHRSRRQNTAIRWLQSALKQACADLGPLAENPSSGAQRG